MFDRGVSFVFRFLIKYIQLDWTIVTVASLFPIFTLGYNWGWILGVGSEASPYICKISKEDIFKIQDHERGPGRPFFP